MVNQMKQNTHQRTKRTKEAKRRSQQVDVDAVRILRTVGDQEAFYFYEAIGKPTGEIARNLYEFLEKVKSVKSESILFHKQRKDFENWIGKTLGDSKLAVKLEEISLTNDDIRTILYRTVENRMKELKEPSTAVLTTENSRVLIIQS
jgi:dihydroxyacetone kinase-like predicted kinase